MLICPEAAQPQRRVSENPLCATRPPSFGYIESSILAMDAHSNTKDVEKEAKVVDDGVTRSMSIDDELLEQLGHVSELRREFSVWSLGSLCLCLKATWEAISSVVATALTNGGAHCLFYN